MENASRNDAIKNLGAHKNGNDNMDNVVAWLQFCKVSTGK
jgi:hypothetical protein